MGVMAVGLFITILLLFHQISSSIQQSDQMDQFKNETQQELVEVRGKICGLETEIQSEQKERSDELTKINSKISQSDDRSTKIGADLKAEIQFERENKTAEIVKLQADLDRTMSFSDLYRDGWSYLAKTASWYKVINQRMTFDQAEAYCANQKDHLASIHSQEENDLVQKLANTFHSNNWFRIGLKSNPNKGNAFEWTDGSSVDFTNWDEGQPHSRTHAMLWSHNGEWAVGKPTLRFAFICKRRSQF